MDVEILGLYRVGGLYSQGVWASATDRVTGLMMWMIEEPDADRNAIVRLRIELYGARPCYYKGGCYIDQKAVTS